MKLILHYLSRYKKLFIINVISVFGFALVELGIPTIIADMIDVGVMNADTDYIIRMGFVVLLISLIGVSMTILLGYCCAKISTAITRDIRNDIFDHAQRFTAYEFNRFGISSMITRTNNDAFQIQMFVNVLLRTALMTPIMFVASIIMTARASLPLSGIIVATIPLIIIGVFVVAKISKPISENQQASLDSLNRISRENLSGIRVIRAFDNDAYEQQRFDDTNEKFTGYSKKLFKLMMMTSPIFFLLMNVAGLCIYWVAALLIQGGDLPLGQLVAFMDYLFHAMFSIMLFCTVFMMYPRAEVSAKRIEAVFDTVPLVHNDGKRMDGNQQGTISFEHVTFVYPDGEEPVLKDVSFSAKKGETIAFIGSTGSGKSTLVNLIPRFYDVSEGSIRIDGVDIRDMKRGELRDMFGMVLQDTWLFSGSIYDNIRYGRLDARKDEIIHAAKMANVHHFIRTLPDGYHSVINEEANNISQGEKQLLTIARAILKDPQILILDEATSSVDTRLEKMLQEAMHRVMEGRTSFVIAHRLSTIRSADLILVINDGDIVEQGTHEELMEKQGYYEKLYNSQFADKE